VNGTEHRNFAVNILGVSPKVYDEMQAMQTARAEGRAAAQNGFSKASNPYVPFEPEHCAWDQGFERTTYELRSAL
jgi:hypothetical protein